MGARHPHVLHVHGHSAVHRAPPHVKILAVFGFAVAVALTPQGAFVAFAFDALLLGVLVGWARLPVGFVVTRALVVLPFVIAALLVPLVATDVGGGTIEVAGIRLAVDGLVAAGTVAARAVLGVLASILLVGTTSPPQLLGGLSRLRLPPVLVQIASFMVRYVEVIAQELARQRAAMVARGHDARWLWQVRPVAASLGTLFIRSYERGERVHAAMLARGSRGTIPFDEGAVVSPTTWLACAIPPAAAALAAVVAAI